MTEINQTAQAMEIIGGSTELSRTYRVGNLGEEGVVTISVSVPETVSEEFWGQMERKFLKLQEEIQRTFA